MGGICRQNWLIVYFVFNVRLDLCVCITISWKKYSFHDWILCTTKFRVFPSDGIFIYTTCTLCCREWFTTQDMFWIGIHHMHSEDSFVNMLNETINYQNWGQFSVLFQQRDCVVNFAMYGWLATDCSRIYPAICSKRIDCKFHTDSEDWSFREK
jgi:hypothetical protein